MKKKNLILIKIICLKYFINYFLVYNYEYTKKKKMKIDKHAFSLTSVPKY